MIKQTGFLQSWQMYCAVFILLLTGCGSQPPQKYPEPLNSALEFEQRGNAAYQAGNYRLALDYFQLAGQKYRLIDDLHAQARNHQYTIQSALLINEFTLAQTELDALQALIDHGGLAEFELTWNILRSDYWIRKQQYAQALQLLEQLLNTDIADSKLRSALLINRATIAIRSNAPDAEQWLQQAELAANNNSDLLQARLLRLKAQLAQQQQNPSSAEQFYTDALTLYRQALFQPGIAATLAELGQLKLTIRDLPASRHLLKRAQTIKLNIGDQRGAQQLTDIINSIDATLTATPAN